MMNTIQQALARIGLNAQKRALHIQFSNSSLNQSLFLQSITGQHQINQGLSAELLCLSTDASIALKQFIGCRVAVDTVTDRGTLSRMTGIITQAMQGQSDGALTLYKLKLEDATALWTKRRNSRVFVSKSALEVLEILFKEWQQRSPLFASSLSLDLTGLTQDYDVRPFIMQSNETDHAFLTRLMREEGINWLLDESENLVDRFDGEIAVQKLRLIDDNQHFQALQRRQIRFHRSSATELSDSITGFIAQRSLQATAVHLQRWQPDALAQEDGAGSVLSKHQHSHLYDNSDLALESAWHMSPAWMQDLNAEDQATASGHLQIEKLNRNMTDYIDSQSKRFIASSTVRDAQVGYWFELHGHAEIDGHTGADKEFLIIGKDFYQQNNLPKDLNEQVQALVLQSQWVQTFQSDERQSNQLTLQRRHIKVVPAYDPLQDRPMAHPQRAKVVGPSDEEIHVDEWGRIKVRFLFTRAEDHAHDGGAGANDNDSDSAWVDVLTPWAGEGYGARFVPRVNEIVVIDFFDGNIDRPFVLGRIHEAHRSPSKFDIKGTLPDTKKLSGIRSQEVGGAGFNQLRFDDTTGQISTQLHSSHGASQLNLGNLSHPKQNAQSDGRGEGFELRSDQWGAVRAGQGLLLSTHAQDQADGRHLDVEAAAQQLQSNLHNAKALSEVAKNQQTDPLMVLDHLKDYIEKISSQDPAKAAAFKSAVMLLSAPSSIALASQADIHVSADAQISQTAGDSINLSTQSNLIAHAQDKISLFAAQKGLSMVAAKDKLELQAQNGEMQAIARQSVSIISTEDSIELTANKKIVLTAAGSRIEISAAGIIVTTAHKFEAKAGQHVFLDGQQVNLELPVLASFENKNWIALELLDAYGAPYADIPYKIHFENNQIIQGRLNAEAKAHHDNVPEKAIKVEYEFDPQDVPWPDYEEVFMALDQDNKE